MTSPTMAVAASQMAHSESGPRLCDCGCGQALKRKQKRWASGACSARWWNAQFPRINRDEAGPRQGTLKSLILGFLAFHDGQWHTEQQIADAIHGFAHSVGARLSEIRRAGHPIEVRRQGRLKAYRLVS